MAMYSENVYAGPRRTILFIAFAVLSVFWGSGFTSALADEDPVCMTVGCEQLKATVPANQMQCARVPVQDYMTALERNFHLTVRDWRIHLHDNPRDANRYGQHKSSFGTSTYQGNLNISETEFGVRDKVWYINDLNSGEMAGACYFDPYGLGVREYDPGVGSNNREVMTYADGRNYVNTGIICRATTWFEQDGNEFKGYCRDCLTFPDNQAADIHYKGTYDIDAARESQSTVISSDDGQHVIILEEPGHPYLEALQRDLDDRHQTLRATAAFKVEWGVMKSSQGQSYFKPWFVPDAEVNNAPADDYVMKLMTAGAAITGQRGALPDVWVVKSFGVIPEIQAINRATEKLENTMKMALESVQLITKDIPGETMANMVGVHSDRKLLFIEYLPGHKSLANETTVRNGQIVRLYPGEFNVCYHGITNDTKNQCLPLGPDMRRTSEGPMGSPTCTDGIDNDENGICDGLEPACGGPDRDAVVDLATRNTNDIRNVLLNRNASRASPPAPLPKPPPQGVKTFDMPMVDGKRLDWCYYWGRECGEPAADAFCINQGYAQALTFEIAENVGDRWDTLVAGDNRSCTDPGCDSFKTIRCTSAAAAAGTRPKQSEVFARPVYNGKRVDYCKNWGTGCGQAAADNFCVRKGFKRATHFGVESNIGDREPTLVLGANKVCAEAACDALKDVTCVRY